MPVLVFTGETSEMGTLDFYRECGEICQFMIANKGYVTVEYIGYKTDERGYFQFVLAVCGEMLEFRFDNAYGKNKLKNIGIDGEVTLIERCVSRDSFYLSHAKTASVANCVEHYKKVRLVYRFQFTQNASTTLFEDDIFTVKPLIRNLGLLQVAHTNYGFAFSTVDGEGVTLDNRTLVIERQPGSGGVHTDGYKITVSGTEKSNNRTGYLFLDIEGIFLKSGNPYSNYWEVISDDGSTLCVKWTPSYRE